MERFGALVDLDAIRSLRLLVAGLGRVGMAVLKRVMEWPIASITAIDHDHVSAKEEGSVFPYGARGQQKVFAAEQIVKAWNPEIAYEGVVMHLQKTNLETFAGYVDKSDVLLFLADDFSLLSDIARVCHGQLPIIATGIGEQGAYAEVAWSFPNHRMSCVACALNARQRQSEAGAASLPSDTDLVAHVVVSCAIGIAVAGRKGYSLFQELLEPSHSLILIHNRKNRFTSSTSQLVAKVVRLVSTAKLSCDVCRRR